MDKPVRHVRVLPEVVANQIAAGEVVERPASVVKELVENALDAGATRVDIDIEGGGIKRISVLDNGCGMTREDAVTSLERQATSKIACSEDITQISTFGFRGEAIPSIASVSRFRMVTRTEASDEGTEVVVTGGVLDAVNDAGHPVGTTVQVRDLFFNVPARRKFLRAGTTEQARIRSSLISIALAHPDVGFSFRADNHDIFRVPLGDTLNDRVRTLLGEPTADAMLPIDTTTGAIHVHGFIASPDFVRGGVPEQYIFVNARPATAPQIQYALREGVPGHGQRPVTILFVDLPPQDVDVNVHPAKREVRFRQGNIVINAVMLALAQTFSNLAPGLEAATEYAPVVPTPMPQDATVAPLSPLAPIPKLSPVAPMPTPQRPPVSAPPPVFAPPPIRQAELNFPEQPEEPSKPNFSFKIPEAPTVTTPEESATKLPWRWYRLAAVLEDGFWLLVTDQGYLTIDAKAALERIVYERLMREEIPIQPLLIPETLTLPPMDAERVTRLLPDLQACGIGISAFSSDTFILDALPVILSETPPKEFVASLAVELDKTGVKKGLGAWQRERIARAAGQSATIAAKDKSPQFVASVMDRLAQCEMPYTTPRGRPVMILTTQRELMRRFKRDS